MAVNPCIEDSDCVSLEVNASSNLVAALIISATAGNCAECTADGLYVPCAGISADACNALEDRGDGLWTPQTNQAFYQTGPSAGAPYDDLTVTGPLAPAGQIIARSGTIDFEAPACGDGTILRAELVGPVQVATVSAGGRVIIGYESRIQPDPYAGGPYAVFKNSGSVSGEHAWPNFTPSPVIGQITAGTAQTLEWKQTYEVTAGTVGSITFQSIFLYIWIVTVSA